MALRGCKYNSFRFQVSGFKFQVMGSEDVCVTDVTDKNATFPIYSNHLYIQSSRVYESLYFICHICHTEHSERKFLLCILFVVTAIFVGFIEVPQLLLLVCLRQLINFVEPSLSCMHLRESEF